MPAPINQYTGKFAWTKKETSPGSGTFVDVAHDIVIYWDTSDAKAFFFLDYIYWFTLPDGSLGWIGLCDENNVSGNIAQHNVNRYGALRLTIDGKNYTAFTDGGLNTKGKVYSLNIIKAQVGDLQLSANYRTPYYDSFSSHGFTVRNLRTGMSVDLDLGTMAQNTITSKNYSGWPFTLGAVAGDTIEVRGYCIAPEGPTYTAYQQTVMQAATISLGFDAYASAAANKYDANVRTTLYMSGPFLSSSDLYADAAMTTNATAGYYSNGNGNSWYKVEIVGGKARVTVTGTASAGNWPSGDPANTEVITWRGYDPSTSLDYGQSCAVLSNGRTTYRNTETNIHYKNPEMTIVADNGTYTRMVGPTTWYWYRMISGQTTSSGICGSGG